MCPRGRLVWLRVAGAGSRRGERLSMFVVLRPARGLLFMCQHAARMATVSRRRCRILL